MKKIKYRGGVLLILLAAMLVTPIFASSLGGNVALRGGFTPSGYDSGKFTFDSGSSGTTVYGSDGVTPLGSSFAVQVYWVGTNGVINDPGYAGNDDLLIGTVKYTGDDADTWNTFAATPGKFYHDFAATDASLTSGANMYFRVWNNSTPAAGGALFGESNLVTAAYLADVMPLPTNNGLNNLTAQFTQAVPAAPTLGTVTPNQAAPGGSPSIMINTATVVHGRWYNFEVSSPETSGSATFTFNSYKTGTVANSYHAADVDTSGTRTPGAITLGQYDDGKYVKVRVQAANDYGIGGWTEGGPYLIPVTPSTNQPVAVADLRVSSSTSSSLTLRWTAPYLLDGHSNLIAASSYDIRIAQTPIIDTWEAGHTNPYNLTTWADATPINTAPYSASTWPLTPATYQNTQEVTVACPTGHAYYAALKSSNGSIVSYISNVTGAQVGGGTSQLSYVLTIESRVSSGGHGINHFSLPFPGPWYAYNGGTLIGTVVSAYDLIKAINTTVSGGAAVSTFTEWLGANSTPSENGIILPNENPDDPAVSGALQGIILQNGTGYELYAVKPATLVIKNY